MNEKGFWLIIEEGKKVGKLDHSIRTEFIINILRTLEEKDIFDFYNITKTKLARLNIEPVRAAATLLFDYCSDDSFEYFRAWVISQGEETFHKVMEDPDNLSEEVYNIAVSGYSPMDFCNEAFLYCAQQAYLKKTGKNDFYDRWGYPGTISNKGLEKRFPKLAKIKQLAATIQVII